MDKGSAHPVAEGLARLAATLVPGGGTVTACRRLSGGASQETWAFTVAGAAGAEDFILRRAPEGNWLPGLAIALETEAELMSRAGASGVPSPGVRHVLAPGDGLGRGFVMGFVAGETLGQRIVKDAAFADIRPRLAGQCGAILARIHGVPAGDIADLRRLDAGNQVDELARMYRAGGQVRPVFDLAFRWLGGHLPPPAPPVLVHGDFRNGNLIFGSEGIRAVLDWELAHLGDPMEDLGWICVASWRFGAIDLPVGGFGRREDLFAAYEAASGRPVDAGAVRFWEVLGTLRWGLICNESGTRFAAGLDRSVERAIIGRRASETEIDLLHLLTGRDD